MFDVSLPSRGVAQKQLIKVINQSIIDFNRKVFLEDKVICAEVQEGIRFARTKGLLSDIEERVHAFQESYMLLAGDVVDA